MWFILALVLAAIAVVVTLLARARRSTKRARRLADGTQEARVIVDRGYVPSRIDLEAGVPATLRFERREDDPCTEMLVSELWPSAHRLVAHGETEIRFTPQRPGRFAFTCGMGMYSGELVVHQGRKI
jgi:plastocyanin domain-containing protein